MSELYDFIKSVGVPAAIAFYVLHRIDRRLNELVAVVQALAGALARRADDPDA
jgi:hypothetical protein